MLSLSHLKQSLPGLRALSSIAPVAKTGGRGGRSSVSDKTITVFGATGRLGRIVVNSLGQTGTQLVVPYRGSPQSATYLRLCGDLGVVHTVNLPHYGFSEDLEDLVKHSDVVINLTGADGPKYHWSMEASNVDLTHRIARACKEMGVPTFIHLSHINADPNSTSEYLRTKSLSEVVVRHELPDAAIIVRASDCFGHKDNFTDMIVRNMRGPRCLRGMTQQYKGGKAKSFTPVYSADVSRAIARIALMHPDDRKELYQFVGPKKYTMEEFCQSISDMTYKPFWPVHNPLRLPIAKRQKYKGDKWIRINTISDTPVEGLPGLVDVGITPTAFEEVAIDWLQFYRPYWNTYDALDGHRTDVAHHPAGTSNL